jgi:hypothetical protein
MDSWIYIFSQFTPEALVLELAAIFIICGAYAVYWIVRKRKYGVIRDEIPAGPVKTYLEELIGTADELRIQLFGLLSAEERAQKSGKSGSLDADSDLGKILANLESKMDAQAKALENITANGVPVVAGTVLQMAPGMPAPGAPAVASADRAGGAAPVNDAEMNELKDKVENLETRLAEYAIIEDDLANLKRIQQENADLRAQLAAKNVGAGAAAPAPVAAPAAPAPAPVAAATTPVAEVAKLEASGLPREGTEMGEDDLVKEFEKMLQG